MATGTIGAGGNLATSNDVYLSFTDDTTETQSVALDNTPADFLTMTSVDWTVEYSLRDTWGDDGYALGIRIVNGATVLAAADSGGTFATVASGITTSTDTTAGPTAFAYVDTSASKSVWDGATIELQQTHSQEMGPDGNTIQVDYASFDIEYPANEVITGSAATTTDTPAAGGTYIENNVIGSTATETDSASVGSEFVEKVILGSSASTLETAATGDYLRTIIGQGAATSEQANAGGIEAHYNLSGGTASTTATANLGSTTKDLIVEGSSATDQQTANAGDIEVYKVTGKADEWGNFVLGGVDEWGSSYEVLENHNEWGDYLDLVAELDISKVIGAQATLTDTPKAGLALTGNDVGGSPASTTDTANPGTVIGIINVEGAVASATDTAQAGIVSQSINIAGSSTTTQETAHSGSVTIDLVVTGTHLQVINVAYAGGPFVEIPVIGSAVTTTAVATGSTFAIDIDGSQTALTEASQPGSVLLPGFIRVQGRKVTTLATGNAGTLGVSELKVFGIPTGVADIPRKGKALGGVEKKRIMIDAEMRDKVTLAA